jgi:hypothetical protein
MTNRHRRALAACVVLAAAVGCHRGAVGSQPTGPTKVVFKNESLQQADVFAVQTGRGPLRLGTVMAGHTDTLTIADRAIPYGSTVNFVARLLASSNAPRSGPVSIIPGDVTLPSTANTLAVLPGARP